MGALLFPNDTLTACLPFQLDSASRLGGSTEAGNKQATTNTQAMVQPRHVDERGTWNFPSFFPSQRPHRPAPVGGSSRGQRQRGKQPTANMR